MTGNGLQLPKRPPQGNDWTLTLADMMTLILCFFILMVSVGQVDREKYEAMSDVMAEAMGGRGAPSKRLIDDGKSSVRSQVAGTETNLFALQLELARLLQTEADDVTLRLEPRAVSIALKDKVLFPSGSAALTPAAKALLGKIEAPLSRTAYSLTIEGHTDDVPIATEHFPSNWELSSARASAVARSFIELGFPPQRVQVKGLADTRPLAPNRDAKGQPIPANQSRNRRVVLLVHPS